MLLAAMILASTPQCLPHGGPQRLAGVLVAHTFPGPPNFESIKDGDTPERYWLLRLGKALCVSPDGDDPDSGAKDVREIQLILTPEDFARYRPLLGKPIVAEGEFMSPMSGHHHTAILLEGVRLTKRP
ncbi:DUF4431 domain-containing protein [Caulobacter segnis]|uniref:DUF4431 domain-containing protein n=1 Tax=Caulobacter segnis TaxID=88688 RepID=A0A2W5X4E6_9CAUL|nr:DUF4431 domain-containing protein [Caulobacter segnis]PZR31561.1 MAG: hypothetical protein DI526_19295 [Caulobacter segnis]